MMKLNWKQRIVSAVLYGAFYAGLLFLFDVFTDDKLYIVNALIIQGVLFGIVMGIAMPYVNKTFGKRFTNTLGKNITPELTENEHIEAEGPVNLFRGIEAVGVKLFLTNKKVIFKSHKINIQSGQTNIEYKNMTEIITRKTAKLADNGIRITTNNGETFDFVVTERDNWIKKLNEKLGPISDK